MTFNLFTSLNETARAAVLHALAKEDENKDPVWDYNGPNSSARNRSDHDVTQERRDTMARDLLENDDVRKTIVEAYQASLQGQGPVR